MGSCVDYMCVGRGKDFACTHTRAQPFVYDSLPLFSKSQPTSLQNDNFRCSELENLLFITHDTITLCEYVCYGKDGDFLCLDGSTLPPSTLR